MNGPSSVVWVIEFDEPNAPGKSGKIAIRADHPPGLPPRLNAIQEPCSQGPGVFRDGIDIAEQGDIRNHVFCLGCKRHVLVLVPKYLEDDQLPTQEKFNAEG